MDKDFTILVAEDDIGHFMLTKRCLESADLSGNIVHFLDGQIAYDFLRDNCCDCDHEKYLLLLDIRMPKIDGVELLKRIKADPYMADIPVVVVSTSDNPENISQCKELGCEDYIIKPLDYSFADKITSIVKEAFSKV